MNHFGYVLTNETISPNLVLKFVFSPEFVLATMIYLIYVFTLFWSIKILGFVLIIVMSTKQISKEMICKVLIKARCLKKNVDGKYDFRDWESKEFVEWFIEDRKSIRDSNLLGRMADVLSVISSSNMFYLVVYNSIPQLKDEHFEVYLTWITIVTFLIAFVIAHLYASWDKLEEIFIEISNDAVDSEQVAKTHLIG